MDHETARALVKRYLPEHNKFIRDAAEAERYYRNETDILVRGAVARREADDPLRNADNRVPSNFHGLLVNQEAAYMFTDPPIFDIGGDGKDGRLSEILGDRFPKFCKDLCVDASNCSIAWAHVWRARDGSIQYAAIDPKQILPIWTDNLNRRLRAVVRTYSEFDDDGKAFDVVEIWTDQDCAAFRKRTGGTFRSMTPYPTFRISAEAEPTNVYQHGYGFVPFVPFPNNNVGTGDLKNIKGLIDCYDKVYSGFLNDLEDIQEVIFILSGYSGTDLGPFLQDLKKYKTVKMDGAGDGASGLTTLTIDIPVEAREKMLAMTRKAIFEQGQGIDPDPQNFGNSSGVALGYLYSLLELKAGMKETEFRLGFAQLVRCLCQLAGIPVESVQQTWTRTSVTNDIELADIAAKSVGIISDETILRRHPWVDDPEAEMERLQEQSERELSARRVPDDGLMGFGDPGGDPDEE